MSEMIITGRLVEIGGEPTEIVLEIHAGHNVKVVGLSRTLARELAKHLYQQMTLSLIPDANAGSST